MVLTSNNNIDYQLGMSQILFLMSYIQAERKRILDSLMPDDMRMLMLFEDEVKNDIVCRLTNIVMENTLSQLSRCGHFERVYPSANSDRYRKFFEMEVR